MIVLYVINVRNMYQKTGDLDTGLLRSVYGLNSSERCKPKLGQFTPNYVIAYRLDRQLHVRTCSSSYTLVWNNNNDY